MREEQIKIFPFCDIFHAFLSFISLPYIQAQTCMCVCLHHSLCPLPGCQACSKTSSWHLLSPVDGSWVTHTHGAAVWIWHSGDYLCANQPAAPFVELEVQRGWLKIQRGCCVVVGEMLVITRDVRIVIVTRAGAKIKSIYSNCLPLNIQ